MKAKEPSIFRYNDYRSYLRDWIEARRAEGFSLRWFAKRAGFKAHNMMQMVMTGKRNLSLASVAKFTRGLGLDDEGAQYFEDLVLMNQAGDMKTRTKHYRKLVEYPDRRAAIPFESSQYQFFRHWLGPVIYEMTRIEGFRADPRWIAGSFTPELTVAEAEAVLSDLVNSGFLLLRPDGTFAPQEMRLDTGDNIGDLHVYAYHEQALSKASDALHWIPGGERHFQVMTVAVSSSILPTLRQLAADFENELWKTIDHNPLPKDEVFQISLQIFPTIGKPIAVKKSKRTKARGAV